MGDREATLALYMARDAAGAVAARLMAEGRSPRTPAIAVENAGRPAARLLRADLASLGAVVEAAAPTGPVLLIIGEVAARAHWPALGQVEVVGASAASESTRQSRASAI